MQRNTWGLFTMWSALAAASGLPSAASGLVANPIVAIEMVNAPEVAGLSRVQALAAEIYLRAGVTVRWGLDEGMAPDRVLTIVLASSSTLVLPDLAVDAMGVAPTPGDGTRGTIAYVFVDKVRKFAISHRLDVAHVLACAVAHEIGHLLLPPNAHRPDSVMRESWYPALFPPRAPALPGFPPDQARLLRLRAHRP